MSEDSQISVLSQTVQVRAGHEPPLLETYGFAALDSVSQCAATKLMQCYWFGTQACNISKIVKTSLHPNETANISDDPPFGENSLGAVRNHIIDTVRQWCVEDGNECFLPITVIWEVC